MSTSRFEPTVEACDAVTQAKPDTAHIAELRQHIIDLEDSEITKRRQAIASLIEAGLLLPRTQQRPYPQSLAEDHPAYWLGLHWNIDSLSPECRAQLCSQLYRHAENADERIRRDVAASLFILGDLRCLPLFLLMLQSRSCLVRTSALTYIRQWGDRSAVLRRLLVDEQFSTSERAKLFLALVEARYHNGPRMSRLYETGDREGAEEVCRTFLRSEENPEVQAAAAAVLPLLSTRYLLRPSGDNIAADREELLRIAGAGITPPDHLLRGSSLNNSGAPGIDVPLETPRVIQNVQTSGKAVPRKSLRDLMDAWFQDWLIDNWESKIFPWLVAFFLDYGMQELHSPGITVPVTGIMLLISCALTLAYDGFDDEITIGVQRAQYLTRLIAALITFLPLFWLALK